MMWENLKTGYADENSISVEMLEQIPVFMLACEPLFYLTVGRDEDVEAFPESSKKRYKRIKQRIVERIPIVSANYRMKQKAK